ncbi:hypothetical protein [Lentzea flava]|uniref:Uncharacterized protein n=1 Tax=Lentzea flava TaxID=103732 RepID=A0ABQ2VGW5_9PSEU|nr:hypothetical protein [Lentzea flava]MCP2205383.1 hypothetical protein [Lentzea flava]GGU86396.1 hypothetical protein GCM10010178_90530 [Lentzea flava]
MGFSRLYGLSRTATKRSAWTDDESELTNVTNELTIALMRNKLVAVSTEITTEPQFKKWMQRELAPFKFFPRDVITNSFRGDAKRQCRVA